MTQATARPPEASAAAARVAQRLVTPIEAFLHVEAASGMVLLVAAVVAMFLANTSLHDRYHALLELPIGARVGSVVVEQPLHFWINDGLMTIFFFVVGLEIRREIHSGELATARRAALPAAAALGGMITPALLYVAVAMKEPVARSGWGIPMATDIAFAVGVLALLGKRVPPAMRVLLLALAIIDDIGGILVIAIFYSGPLALSGIAIAVGGVLGILVLQRIGVRRALLYVPPAIVVWLGLLRSGVHPTIGGVVVGLLTPARTWFGATGLVETARTAAERVANDEEALHEEARRIELARREAVAPAERLQTLLHPWVAFGIMPIFALANAGVTVDASAARPNVIAIGIVVGLVLGKPIGILALSLLAVRLRIAALPRAVGLRELLVVGVVAGVGFTMAIFVAGLAFSSEAELAQAKIGILAASAIAIVLALAAGRVLLRATPVPDAAKTASEAECSDEM